MSKSLKVLQQDCDKSAAEDKTLPYTCYLVEYYSEGKVHYDLVTAVKQVDIFDEYWDKYKQGFVGMKQSEGRINPKNWGPPNKGKDKK